MREPSGPSAQARSGVTRPIDERTEATTCRHEIRIRRILRRPTRILSRGVLCLATGARIEMPCAAIPARIVFREPIGRSILATIHFVVATDRTTQTRIGPIETIVTWIQNWIDPDEIR